MYSYGPPHMAEQAAQHDDDDDDDWIRSTISATGKKRPFFKTLILFQALGVNWGDISETFLCHTAVDWIFHWY